MWIMLNLLRKPINYQYSPGLVLLTSTSSVRYQSINSMEKEDLLTDKTLTQQSSITSDIQLLVQIRFLGQEPSIQNQKISLQGPWVCQVWDKENTLQTTRLRKKKEHLIQTLSTIVMLQELDILFQIYQRQCKKAQGISLKK